MKYENTSLLFPRPLPLPALVLFAGSRFPTKCGRNFSYREMNFSRASPTTLFGSQDRFRNDYSLRPQIPRHTRKISMRDGSERRIDMRGDSNAGIRNNGRPLVRLYSPDADLYLTPKLRVGLCDFEAHARAHDI